MSLTKGSLPGSWLTVKQIPPSMRYAYLESVLVSFGENVIPPLAAYQEISFSDRNFSMSARMSSFILPGSMTDGQGLLGRVTGFCHSALIRLFVVMSL
jgi:hypothetical protein